MGYIGRIAGRIGDSIYKWKLKGKVRFDIGARIDRMTLFEGNNYMGKNSSFRGSSVGRFSYVANDTCLVNCSIGRYTSIGAHVCVAEGNHPTGRRSTHPVFFSSNPVTGNSYVDVDSYPSHRYIKDEQGRDRLVVIGNDVWIGTGAILLEGINIGDGSIIAAGAVVNRDVKPYEVVGGVPVRTIRMRFKQEIIEQLENDKWWTHDDEWISEHIAGFTGELE